MPVHGRDTTLKARPSVDAHPAMHELAVCQALLMEVERVARKSAAGAVTRVIVRVGPLSGIEPQLLSRAFSVARAGGAARDAALCIEAAPVRVRCLACDAESEAAPQRLVCAHCGGWRTRLLSGDEMTLQRLEFRPAAPLPATAAPAAVALH
jgi:hydrogenase nickel incorporation protein HypA/HybF